MTSIASVLTASERTLGLGRLREVARAAEQLIRRREALGYDPRVHVACGPAAAVNPVVSVARNVVDREQDGVLDVTARAIADATVGRDHLGAQRLSRLRCLGVDDCSVALPPPLIPCSLLPEPFLGVRQLERGLCRFFSFGIPRYQSPCATSLTRDLSQCRFRQRHDASMPRGSDLPGEDPYTVHEFRTDEERNTTQDGTVLDKGPP
jgi:hypothetical protein